ncbi:glycosyltransferase family 4 protein [Hyphomicrobium sp.]|uniref:glycosyltransferase family 4 protein n=1 Tax=Hyphomicrobium sp. TaxID=82 RepID=UPI001D65C202|nr:glycosyltransferase family 4 protein [Hyphomicrobium sp.]MBY0561303.1 glycosyltransferase family 4 protein [Hyphomicrobium sp.]
MQTEQSDRTKQVLLTVSGTIPQDLPAQIAGGQRPRADYLELARGLKADILDYTKARTVVGGLAPVLERLGGANLVLAYACWKLRSQYRLILTDGEQIGLPLAALMKVTPGYRPRHFMITHIISVPKKALILDVLRLHSQIDGFIVYSRWQKRFIKDRWRLDDSRVLFTPFMVDDQFFAPGKVEPKSSPRPLICAVGLERRDYPTLLKSVEGLDLDLVIAAASPWSKRKDSTTGQHIPGNVTVRKFDQYALRQLYADARFVVMPLEPVDFQAGVTAILEAMAMGKAVICSRVPGQTDVIVDNENGRYVPVGDASALREEISRLLAEPEDAARLGNNGRRLVENEMNLDHYVNRLANFLNAVP